MAATTPSPLTGLGEAIAAGETTPTPTNASSSGGGGGGGGSGAGGGGASAADDKAIGRSRRRLTLAGANVLLDGVGSMTLQSPQVTGTPGGAGAVPLHEEGAVPQKIGHVFGQRFGMCNKGYAPYNPAKKNQDSMILVEDPKTGALFMGVLDGHGEVRFVGAPLSASRRQVL
jgi:hypothetical protein